MHIFILHKLAQLKRCIYALTHAESSLTKRRDRRDVGTSEVILGCLAFPRSAFYSHFFVGPALQQMVQPRVGIFFSNPLSCHSLLPFFFLRFFFNPPLLFKVPLPLPSPFWSPFTPLLHPEVHKSTHHNSVQHCKWYIHLTGDNRSMNTNVKVQKGGSC